MVSKRGGKKVKGGKEFRRQEVRRKECEWRR